MSLDEFLMGNNEDLDSFYNFYIEYLGSIFKNEFSYQEQVNFRLLSKKFIEKIDEEKHLVDEEKEKFKENIDDFLKSITHFQKINNYNKIVKYFYSNRINSINKDSVDIYSILKEKSINYINEAKSFRKYKAPDFILNDFYKPENVDRDKIRLLLKEAILLISNDENISYKTKESLTKQILKIIENLDKKYYTINAVLGSISEVIIVLGGLGSFIGGLSPLFMAKEKLEETTKVVERSSININQKIINQTFNIKNIESLQYMNQKINLIENIDEKKNE